MAKTTNYGRVMEVASQLTSANFLPFSSDVRSRVMKVSFNVIERMTESDSLINAIINKRCQQVRPFCKVAVERNDTGFKIQPRGGKDTKGKHEKRIKELEDFMMQTGHEYVADREDDLADFVQYLTRDALVYDQNATEIRRTRDGKVYDFWYVDPVTIVRAMPTDKKSEMRPRGMAAGTMRGSELKGDDIRFVQRGENDKIIAQYTPDQMIFDYMHKRSRMRNRGYGWSLSEQCIDVITTFLFAMTYNRDLFLRDRIPKGFLAVMGDVDDKALRAVRNHWVNEMTGYGAKWKIPILPSGKDGVGIDWKPMGQTNRDMEYLKLLSIIIGLKCAVFGIDAAELGLKTEWQTALTSDSGEARIQASKDTGLAALLAYVETYLNKILMKVDSNYVFTFTGIKKEDETIRVNLRKARLETDTTIDELREEDGKEPFNEEWSQLPLNPQVVQIFQQAKMQEQQQGMMGGGPGGAPGGAEGPPEIVEEGGEEGAAGASGPSYEVESSNAKLENAGQSESASSPADLATKSKNYENAFFTIEV